MGGVKGIGMATQYQSGRRRRVLLATALACAVLGIVLLAGARKRGWFGGVEKGTAQEMVFDLGNGVKMNLCWCPPGTLLMGSPATEAGREANESRLGRRCRTRSACRICMGTCANGPRISIGGMVQAAFQIRLVPRKMGSECFGAGAGAIARATAAQLVVSSSRPPPTAK